MEAGESSANLSGVEIEGGTVSARDRGRKCHHAAISVVVDSTMNHEPSVRASSNASRRAPLASAAPTALFTRATVDDSLSTSRLAITKSALAAQATITNQAGPMLALKPHSHQSHIVSVAKSPRPSVLLNAAVLSRPRTTITHRAEMTTRLA